MIDKSEYIPIFHRNGVQRIKQLTDEVDDSLLFAINHHSFSFVHCFCYKKSTHARPCRQDECEEPPHRSQASEYTTKRPPASERRTKVGTAPPAKW